MAFTDEQRIDLAKRIRDTGGTARVFTPRDGDHDMVLIDEGTAEAIVEEVERFVQDNWIRGER